MESVVKLNIHDYAAMEADLLLLSFLYSRTNATDSEWLELSEKIEYLKSLIYNGK